MKAIHLLLFSAVLSLPAVPAVFGGEQFFNFDLGGNPATGDPAQDPRFLVFGNNLFSDWQPAFGNPDNGGYLAFCNGFFGQNLAVVFPDADLFTNADDSVISLPIEAFAIDMDLRVGNGFTEHGADGFSVSFVRADDQVLINATNYNGSFAFGGFAGGDSDAEATAVPPTSGDAENGVRTGLSVCFDTWAGNFLPRNGVLTGTTPGTPDDTEGIEIRVDDVTLLQQPMTNADGTFDRNGNCTADPNTPVPPGTPPYPDCSALACSDPNTFQTGPWDGSDDFSVLCWQPLHIELNANREITVIWKGHTLVDHFELSTFNPSQARLVLAGRTGGAAQNLHVDNLHVVTVANVIASFAGIQPAGPDGLYGFAISYQNVGPSIVTNFTSVVLDGNHDVTSQIVLSSDGQLVTGTYLQNTPLAPGAHPVTGIAHTTLGQLIPFSTSFTVPDWVALPTSNVLPLASVSHPGFVVRSYQTLWLQPEPNHNYWADEQLQGYHGPNVADQSGTVNGVFSYSGAVDFSSSFFGDSGFFVLNPFLPDQNAGYDFNFANFGIPGPNATNFGGFFPVGDNSSLELNAYVYFPTSGIYQVFVGSDDGFRLSVAANALDRIGTTLMEFDGGRGIGQTAQQATTRFLIVNQPGCYPMRLIWENSGGGYALEWYIRYANGQYILVNDDGSGTGEVSPVKAFQAANVTPPYVKAAIPVEDARNVPLDQTIDVSLADGTLQVDPSTVNLILDGAATPVMKRKTGNTTHVVYNLIKFWPRGSKHTVQLAYQDARKSPNRYTNQWSFTVETNDFPIASIPVAWGLPPTQIDHSRPGFLVRSYQTTAAQPNTIQWTKEQFLGLHGPNIADQTGATNNGAFYWPNVVDFSGLFGFLGFAGGGFPYNFDLSNFGIQQNPFNPDNCSAIFEAWVEFPAPGIYTMEINSDDGFLLSLFPSKEALDKDGSGMVISLFDGPRPINGTYGGTKADLYVPVAHAYLFQLLWENGQNGAGVEWSIGQHLPDGSYQDLLINETNVFGTIKAYAFPE